ITLYMPIHVQVDLVEHVAGHSITSAVSRLKPADEKSKNFPNHQLKLVAKKCRLKPATWQLPRTQEHPIGLLPHRNVNKIRRRQRCLCGSGGPRLGLGVSGYVIQEYACWVYHRTKADFP